MSKIISKSEMSPGWHPDGVLEFLRRSRDFRTVFQGQWVRVTNMGRAEAYRTGSVELTADTTYVLPEATAFAVHSNFYVIGGAITLEGQRYFDSFKGGE